MNIMVIDDEPDIEMLFKHKFRKEIRNNLIDINFFLSASDGLSYLRNNIDSVKGFILSDINMPGMTGLEMLKLIKEDFPESRVIMITAYDGRNYRDCALEFGADGYMTKPLDFRQLKETLFSQ